MAWKEHWWEVALDVLTGGIYSAAKGGTEAVVEATSPDHASPSPPGINISLPGMQIGAHPGIVPPSPIDLRNNLPQRGSVGGPCCERFKLENGFLLDTSTGRVWRFDQKLGSFLSIPLQYGGDDQDLAQTMMEQQMKEIRKKYDHEVLSTLPARARATQMAVFEKEFIAPIRRSAFGKAAARSAT